MKKILMTEPFVMESIKNLKYYIFDLSLEYESIESDDLRTIYDTIQRFYDDYDCSEPCCLVFEYEDFEMLMSAWIDSGDDFEDVFKNYLDSVEEEENA